MLAHAWLSLAADQSLPKAHAALGELTPKMTAAELAKARSLAEKWPNIPDTENTGSAAREAPPNDSRRSADAERRFQAGLEALDKSDHAAAFAAWKPLAEQGDAQVQVIIGSMYEQGAGVRADLRAAAKCYRAAAEQGYADGQHNLAVMYERGEGVSRSPDEALKWYHLAAEQGHVGSQSALGSMYTTGHGVAENHTVAVKWYRLAAEKGHIEAQYNLGLA